MAEAALGGLATAVLKQLASPAIKEFKLLWGHKKKLKKLENTINTIRNVLEDADRKQADSKAVRGWLARLRVVLYDADDLFDHVAYLVLQEKADAGGKMTKKVSHLASKPKHLFEQYQEAKAIRKSLEDIAGDINKFGLITSLARTDQEQPNRVRREQTHSYVPSSEVVDRDQERDDIVELLLADNGEGKRGVSVVAVIGIGGMGKTTLAQFVYRDERIQQGFDLCMWCCVNYFDLKVALEAIIKSATGSAAPERLDVDQLQSLLRNAIDGRRFLLVLDDVWDEDERKWRELQRLLNSGKGGSVILATTRHVEVAQKMHAVEPHYHLEGLSDEGAWMLFKKIAFEEGSEEQNCPELEELGREIVKKCGNSPLAVEIIAGLLRDEGRNMWFSIVNGELSKVVPVEHGKVMQVLKMSYNTLSSPVKRCFAYCSLFGKGGHLHKDKFVHMWIAQGYCAAGGSLEDVAEGYFSCLVNRCFIQNCEGSYFKMHDLVLDLASEAAGSESILVDKINPNFGGNALRHVSLLWGFTDCAEQLSSFSQSKKLRTCLIVGVYGRLEMENADKLISCFKAARVLGLSFAHIRKVPDSIGQLIHLRYLNLSNNRLEVLPSSICTIHHLQYLDLSYNPLEMLPSSICNLHHLRSLNLVFCDSLKELPKEIEKLISLRHLQIEFCEKLSEMPQGLTDLTSLVTLDTLIVHNSSGGLRYLECLDSLSGSLKINLPGTVWKDAATDAQKACLSKKHKLRELHVQWKESEDLVAADTVMVMNALQPHSSLKSLYIDTFVGEKMPRWIRGLHNLVSLTIRGCGRCVELPSLRSLRFLKVLEISTMSSMIVIEEDGIGRISDDSDSKFFPSLETLSICGMPKLTGWWKQAPSIQPAFRSVTKVTILNCPKLTTCMPLFPQVEDLYLNKIQKKLFWQAIGSDGTNKLKTLRLTSIRGLRRLPSDRIRHLSALRVMELGSSNYLPITRHVLGVECLTSLQELAIIRYKEVYLSWGVVLGLPHLRILKFDCLEKVIDVGSAYVQRWPDSPLQELVIERTSGECLEGIPWRSFPSLRSLKLAGITNLKELPQGIQHLTALQNLVLEGCRSVVSMPNWVTGFSSLHSLHVYWCSPEVNEECKRLKGEDWPNMRDIPLITVNYEVI